MRQCLPERGDERRLPGLGLRFGAARAQQAVVGADQRREGVRAGQQLLETPGKVRRLKRDQHLAEKAAVGRAQAAGDAELLLARRLAAADRSQVQVILTVMLVVQEMVALAVVQPALALRRGDGDQAVGVDQVDVFDQRRVNLEPGDEALGFFDGAGAQVELAHGAQQRVGLIDDLQRVLDGGVVGALGVLRRLGERIVIITIVHPASSEAHAQGNDDNAAPEERHSRERRDGHEGASDLKESIITESSAGPMRFHGGLRKESRRRGVLVLEWRRSVRLKE